MPIYDLYVILLLWVVNPFSHCFVHVKLGLMSTNVSSVMFSPYPLFFFSFRILGIGEGLPLLPYGDKFNLHRKLLQQPFSKRGCDKFLDIQTKQRGICLQSLLRKPEDFERHTKRFVILPTLYTPAPVGFPKRSCLGSVGATRRFLPLLIHFSS